MAVFDSSSESQSVYVIWNMKASDKVIIESGVIQWLNDVRRNTSVYLRGVTPHCEFSWYVTCADVNNSFHPVAYLVMEIS